MSEMLPLMAITFNGKNRGTSASDHTQRSANRESALRPRQRRQKAGMRSTSTLYTSSRPVSMAKLSHHFTASG